MATLAIQLFGNIQYQLLFPSASIYAEGQCQDAEGQCQDAEEKSQCMGSMMQRWGFALIRKAND